MTGLTSGQDETRWPRNFGLMVHVEPINRDFVKHHFPNDSSGNLYTKRGTSSSEWLVASSPGDGSSGIRRHRHRRHGIWLGKAEQHLCHELR